VKQSVLQAWGSATICAYQATYQRDQIESAIYAELRLGKTTVAALIEVTMIVDPADGGLGVAHPRLVISGQRHNYGSFGVHLLIL